MPDRIVILAVPEQAWYTLAEQLLQISRVNTRILAAYQQVEVTGFEGRKPRRRPASRRTA